MIRMRRRERLASGLVIGLLAARPHVSMSRKSMKLVITRYMSYSYQTIIPFFRNDLQRNDKLLATKPLLVDIQRLLNS